MTEEHDDGDQQRVMLGAVLVLVHQPLAALIYGALASHSGQWSWYVDYVHEYLLWRWRMPFHALSDTDAVANVLALLLLGAVGVLVGGRDG